MEATRPSLEGVQTRINDTACTLIIRVVVILHSFASIFEQKIVYFKSCGLIDQK